MWALAKPLLAGLITATLLTPESPPPQAWVTDFTGYPQQYNLSCEIRSATDVANFWGVPVSEDALISTLPVSDDPNMGFIGDITAPAGSLPPIGYGVYAHPVAYILKRAGLNAHPHHKFSLDQIKREIAQGRPVIVWGTYGMKPGEVQAWTTQLGRIVSIVRWEHSFVAVGYDEGGIYLVDAYDATLQYYAYDAFLSGWDMLERMAVTVSGHHKPETALATREIDGYPHFIWRDQTVLGPW